MSMFNRMPTGMMRGGFGPSKEQLQRLAEMEDKIKRGEAKPEDFPEYHQHQQLKQQRHGSSGNVNPPTSQPVQQPSYGNPPQQGYDQGTPMGYPQQGYNYGAPQSYDQGQMGGYQQPPQNYNQAPYGYNNQGQMGGGYQQPPGYGQPPQGYGQQQQPGDNQGPYGNPQSPPPQNYNQAPYGYNNQGQTGVGSQQPSHFGAPSQPHHQQQPQQHQQQHSFGGFQQQPMGGGGFQQSSRQPCTDKDVEKLEKEVLDGKYKKKSQEEQEAEGVRVLKTTSHYFTAKQCHRLLRTDGVFKNFGNVRSPFKAASFLYSRCVDKENFVKEGLYGWDPKSIAEAKKECGIN